MKPLLLFIFLYLFFLPSHGKDAVNTDEIHSQTAQESRKTDESPRNRKKIKQSQNNLISIKKDSSNMKNKSPEKETIMEKTRNSKSLDNVTKMIKKVFIDFLDILEKEPLNSKEYAKAVRFLENSLYSEANFETLKLLATVYKEKKDFINQTKVLNILSVNYSNNPEAFYLLGMAHKHLYLNEEEDKKENKEKSITNFNQALKINPKHTLAYESLMDILMTENPKTKEKIHTKESLSVAMDMLRTFKKNKYYIQLCKAYYDNNFIKQSRKACTKSVQKNPNDPISPLILALSRKNIKRTNKELLAVAKKFKESFLVQYKTALFFMDKDPKVATTYFNSAYILQPENITLNQIMAQFLFDNGEEEKSYTHFLNACQLTDGNYLRKFRIAKRQLRKKNMPDLIVTFQKGIDQCFLSAKKKHSQKKQF